MSKHDSTTGKFRHRKSSLWNIKIDTRPQEPNERKYSEADSVNSDQRAKIRHCLKRNRFIITLSNQFSSLEVAFRRFSDRKSYFGSKKFAYHIAYVRFYWFALILIRFICAAIFHSCDYSNFRYYIYDWSVFYPSDRRFDLMRCFIALCCIQLTLKRCVFFKKPLDTSLIDYLCNPPDKNNELLMSELNTARLHCMKDQEQVSNVAQRRMSMDYQSYSRYLDGINVGKSKFQDDIDVDMISPKLVFFKDSLYDLIEDPNLNYAKFENDLAFDGSVYYHYNRGQNHWLEVSRILELSFRRAVIWMVPLGAVIGLASCFRLGYLLDVQRQCDPRPPLLRFVGVLEVMLCLGDFTLSLLGMIVHIAVVVIDLRHQARSVEKDLHSVLELLGNNINQSGISFDNVSDFLDYKDRANSIKPRSLSKSPMTSDTDDLDDELLDEFQAADIDVCQLDNNIQQTKQQNDISLNWIECHPKFRMNLKEGEDKRLKMVQCRVIGFLTSMDRQKRLFSVAGESQYMWLASTLPFVPLLVKSLIDITVTKHLLPNLIYMILVCFSVTFTILLTAAGANINQKALRIGKMIFKVCAECTYFDTFDGATKDHWNKVLLTWYCPTKCAFYVGDIIKMTNLNILKSISFLISGITLVVTYLGRR